MLCLLKEVITMGPVVHRGDNFVQWKISHPAAKVAVQFMNYTAPYPLVKVTRSLSK